MKLSVNVACLPNFTIGKVGDTHSILNSIVYGKERLVLKRKGTLEALNFSQLCSHAVRREQWHLKEIESKDDALAVIKWPSQRCVRSIE